MKVISSVIFLPGELAYLLSTESYKVVSNNYGRTLGNQLTEHGPKPNMRANSQLSSSQVVRKKSRDRLRAIAGPDQQYDLCVLRTGRTRDGSILSQHR